MCYALISVFTFSTSTGWQQDPILELKQIPRLLQFLHLTSLLMPKTITILNNLHGCA